MRRALRKLETHQFDTICVRLCRIGQYPAPAPSPRFTGEGPSVSDPYPHDAFYRRPAASPQAFHLPRLDCLQPQQSPIRHIAPWHRFGRPVGFVVVFLRRARRSRIGAGWGSPRIVFLAWWPVRRHTVVAIFVMVHARRTAGQNHALSTTVSNCD
jgi:hypothetical protein